jgi:hypothetical protein
MKILRRKKKMYTLMYHLIVALASTSNMAFREVSPKYDIPMNMLKVHGAPMCGFDN